MYESPILTISKKLDIVKYDTNVTYWKTQMLGCKMLKCVSVLDKKRDYTHATYPLVENHLLKYFH
jgi:hypothetical protein